MKRLGWAMVVVIFLCAGGAGAADAFEFPEEALLLLARGAADPCSICADESMKKAFGILEKAYAPGRRISADGDCLFVKPPGESSLDLALSCYPPRGLTEGLRDNETPPAVSFTFHAPGKRLVGISEGDFTSPGIVDAYEQARPGTLFRGRVEIVRYPYGDRDGFNYFRESGRLRIHCRVLELQPAGS